MTGERMNTFRILSFLIAVSAQALTAAQEPGAPAGVTEGDFEALRNTSPFVRSLNLSESLILTGIARVQGDLYATLYDRETNESHVVSQSANPQGWRMVGVAGDEKDLEKVTAQISVAGGEVFSVRFDERQLRPKDGKLPFRPGGAGSSPSEERSLPTNYKEGFSGDGYRGPPPPEIVQKMEKLSESGRNELMRQAGEIREKYRDKSREERQAIFVRMLDQAVKDRR
jgi:hypothetical protein